MTQMTILGLGLFRTRRRSTETVGELDIALAGAQIGLEKKRQRWLLFLIENEQACLEQIAQAEALNERVEAAGEHPSGS